MEEEWRSALSPAFLASFVERADQIHLILHRGTDAAEKAIQTESIRKQAGEKLSGQVYETRHTHGVIISALAKLGKAAWEDGKAMYLRRLADLKGFDNL